MRLKCKVTTHFFLEISLFNAHPPLSSHKIARDRNDYDQYNQGYQFSVIKPAFLPEQGGSTDTTNLSCGDAIGFESQYGRRLESF
jgi:hypothetical protein